MNYQEALSGRAGLAGVQWALSGQSSRRNLRRNVRTMLRPGYHPGVFQLTRAKFKPGRKLLAYFSFPVHNAEGEAHHSAHLAVAWQTALDDADHTEDWGPLQAEADRSGLMPFQCNLWKNVAGAGIQLKLWPFDPKFPQLVRMGDPAYVAGRLDSLGLAQDLQQAPVITPIRYRPGERHVLRYEVPSPGSLAAEGQRLYAKFYSSAEAASRAFDVAHRVVDWLAANDCGLKGNRPAALSGEDGVILYSHAPGTPLSQRLDQSPGWLRGQLQIIGRALAILHDGPETLQAGLKQNDFISEAKVVRRASEHIQVLLPEAYDAILKILDRAQELYLSLPQEKPTFAHADFKADHLLATPQGLTLIDFDTCTLTDPALDVGKFLADLDWWFDLRGLSGVGDAQAELRKAYLGGGKPDRALDDRLARARLFHALILVKIVARRVPLYDRRWAAITERLIGRAADVLQRSIEA